MVLGVDTPEKAGGPRPAECHGQAATDFTESLIPPDTQVQLATGQETRDQYGRLLAFVFRRSDGILINQALVARGHATALFYAPNTELQTTFRSAAMAARRERLGFWSTCGGLPGPVQAPDD